jgi:hypothetical protein
MIEPMGAALALAVMLVVVVGVLSLAVNAQGPFQGAGPGGAPPRPARASHPGGAAPAPPRSPKRPPRERSERARERSERAREREAPAPPPASKEPEHPSDADLFGDVKPLDSEAQALVISVVDERTLGPVTRSRLTLRVEPKGGSPFEVITRVAFPTPEDRARVKVGAMIPVRYDSDDHHRVVVDMDKDAGG